MPRFGEVTLESPRFNPALLHPRYWPVWIGIGLWWLTSLLPRPAMFWLGRALGRAMYHLGGFRRVIAARNLELCFPQLAPHERAALLRRNFENTGISLFEAAMAWWWPWSKLGPLVTFEGLEHLRQLNGRGALLMVMHFTTLEIAGQALGHHFDCDGMYRPHKNPVYDYWQRRRRVAGHSEAEFFTRDDIRGVMRTLRRGRALWYAPDQDYGPKQSVFAPFFGVSAASITATARLAKAGNALVLPLTFGRRADNTYWVKVCPPLEDFPGDDEVADATRINQVVEAAIVQQPDQYLWVHRRFKTRPRGEPSLYSVDKTRRKRTRDRRARR